MIIRLRMWPFNLNKEPKTRAATRFGEMSIILRIICG